MDLVPGLRFVKEKLNLIEYLHGTPIFSRALSSLPDSICSFISLYTIHLIKSISNLPSDIRDDSSLKLIKQTEIIQTTI